MNTATQPIPMSAEAYSEDFNFSLEPKQFGPFSIGEKQFILREATEAAHVAYKNEGMKGVKVTGKTIDSMSAAIEGTNMADTILVQKCLFEIVKSNNPEIPVRYNQVDLGYVLNLPRRITQRLYAKVRHLSGMDAEETPEAIKKQIEALQQRLLLIEKDGAAGKGGPPSTTSTS